MIGCRGSFFFIIIGLIQLVNLGRCQPGKNPTIILHLSDIHVSVNKNKYWNDFGDREGDAKLFAAKVSARLDPSALIITGDLTDGKTYSGAGKQHSDEWRSYNEIINSFIDTGHLTNEQIFDTRGNHDVFNLVSPKYSSRDLFNKHSAWSFRNETSRVLGALVYPVHFANKQSSSDEELTNKQSVAALTNWRRLQNVNLNGDSGMASNSTCPIALILGIDFSEDPGLKNPFNFVGHSDDALSTLVVDVLKTMRENLASVCDKDLIDQIPIISYGHYPLSTIHHHMYHQEGDSKHRKWASVGLLGGISHAFLSSNWYSLQGVAKLLAEIPVSLYLSGHLHSTFGDKLHRSHFNSDPQKGYMNELETSAWKDERRFRVIAIDSGAICFCDLHFHTPNSPTKQKKVRQEVQKTEMWKKHFKTNGWGITAVDPSALILDHIVIQTWPTDSRYGLNNNMYANVASRIKEYFESKTEFDEVRGSLDIGLVRAIVLPLMDVESDGKPQNYSENFTVSVTAYMPDGKQLFRKSMNRIRNEDTATASLHFTYAAFPRYDFQCGDTESDENLLKLLCNSAFKYVELQISLLDKGGLLLGASAKQPAQLLCKNIGNDHHECIVSPSLQPLSLGHQSWLETITLLVNWPVVLYRCFFLLWLAYVLVILFLPRKLSNKKWLVSRILVSGSAVPQLASILDIENLEPFKALHRRSRSSSPSCTDLNISMRTLNTKVADEPLQLSRIKGLTNIINAGMWPYAALILMSQIDEVWFSMLLYAVYYIVGPLFVGDLMSGSPPSFVFHFGCIGKYHGKWQAVPTPDTLSVSLLHMILCIIPVTFWIACVLGRHMVLSAHAHRHQRCKQPNGTSMNNQSTPSDGKGGIPMEQLLSAPQACALLAIGVVNWIYLYSKSLDLLGIVSLVISPGLFWTIPLSILLIIKVKDKIYALSSRLDGSFPKSE